jgi:two-component system, OmpR family, response regulator
MTQLVEQTHEAKSRSGAKSQILVVEDDPAVSKLLKTYLEREGYAVMVAETVGEMRAAVERAPVDMIILDVVLPDEDGWSALRWLRARHALPVIMLTGKAEPVDRVIGLELGADDYVAKPFDLRELLARMRTIQRRLDKMQAQPPANHDEAIAFAGWTLDIVSQQLRSDDGKAAHLTQAEYRILALLARNPRRVVSRDELMDATAGRDWEPFDRSIDVHISNLRRKIDPDPKQPSLIRTVRGAGYMFVPHRG